MASRTSDRAGRGNVEIRLTLFEDVDTVVYQHFRELSTMRARAFEARRLLTAALLSSATPRASYAVVPPPAPPMPHTPVPFSAPRLASTSKTPTREATNGAEPPEDSGGSPLSGFTFSMDG